MRSASLICCCVLVTACGETAPPWAYYPGPWKNDANESIAETLAAHQVRGCGEFWYLKRAYSGADFIEYLVYCPDGKNWRVWTVWPRLNKVTGPERPKAQMLPPN
jgi:hypothetical protein